MLNARDTSWSISVLRCCVVRSVRKAKHTWVRSTCAPHMSKVICEIFGNMPSEDVRIIPSFLVTSLFMNILGTCRYLELLTGKVAVYNEYKYITLDIATVTQADRNAYSRRHRIYGEAIVTPKCRGISYMSLAFIMSTVKASYMVVVHPFAS